MGRPPTPLILYFPAQQACILYEYRRSRKERMTNLPSYYHSKEQVWKAFPNYKKVIVGTRTSIPYRILREACRILDCEQEYPWYFMPSNQWHPELREYIEWPTYPGGKIVDFQWRQYQAGNPNYPTYK